MLYAPRATLSAKPPVWCVIVPRSASSSESLIRSPVLRAQLVLLRPPASPSVTGGAPAIASYAFLALAHAQYAQGYGRAPLPREHALPAARMHACRRQRARASPPRSRRTRPRCISAAQRVLAFTAAKPAPAAAPGFLECIPVSIFIFNASWHHSPAVYTATEHLDPSQTRAPAGCHGGRGDGARCAGAG